MPTAAPKTQSNQVVDEANALLSAASRYMAEDDFRFLGLARKAQVSTKATPANGHSALSIVYQLSGNEERFRHHIENAIQLSGDPVFLGNRVAGLVNLGRFSAAQEVFARAIDPVNGQFTTVWPMGYNMGAFHSMRRALEKAKQMNLDLGGLDLDSVLKAADVLDKGGVEEHAIARKLDLMGEVMRENRLFYAGTAPLVTAVAEPGHPVFLQMAFRFEVSDDEAHALYMQFVDRMAERTDLPEILSVQFLAAAGARERVAA